MPSRAEIPALAPLALPADRHPVTTLLARLQPRARKTYTECLERIVRLVAPYLTIHTFPWSELRYQHVAAIRQALIERPALSTSGVSLNHPLAPATVNLTLAALRSVVKECWRLGYIPAEDLHRILDVPRAKGTRLMAGRALDATKEIATMFQSCRVDPNARRGARDAAMLVLMFYCGLRRDEVSRLRLDQIQVDDPSTNDWWLRVIGKGNKERAVPIPPEGVPWLRWWLDTRPEDPGPLLLPIPQWSTRPPVRPMTLTAVYAALRRRVQLAQIAPATPHDLRRTYITELLDRGVDVGTVAKLVGHAQLETTQRYDRRPQRSLRTAVERLRLRPGKERPR